MADYKKQVEEAVVFLKGRLGAVPGIGLVLGTGLGELAGLMEPDLVLPYGEIPHFPRATVESHRGELVCGRLAGRPVVVLNGRFHYYEGYSTRELTLPVRVLGLLGVEVLLLTNAAGGLNPAFRPGTIMLARDHLNFIPENPLRGPNVDSWGPRFPDLSEPYDRKLLHLALKRGVRLDIGPVTSGVYVAVPGPSLETPAETHFLRSAGADAVGMSSVPEVIVARHGGLRVLALSVIANVNDPDDFKPISVDRVISQAQKAGPGLLRLVVEVLREI